MKSDLYMVTIPAVLTSLVGKGKVRDSLEEAAQTIFADWAHPTLVEKIKVTKPRTSKKNGEEGG